MWRCNRQGAGFLTRHGICSVILSDCNQKYYSLHLILGEIMEYGYSLYHWHCLVIVFGHMRTWKVEDYM